VHIVACCDYEPLPRPAELPAEGEIAIQDPAPTIIQKYTIGPMLLTTKFVLMLWSANLLDLLFRQVEKWARADYVNPYDYHLFLYKQNGSGDWDRVVEVNRETTKHELLSLVEDVEEFQLKGYFSAYAERPKGETI
jgi:hypothetical protein